MKKEIENWLSSARYDLAVAKDMLEADRYPYTVFFCHLAVEKALKAKVQEVTVFFCHLAVEKALKAKVQEVTGRTPPKIHDLVALLKLTQLAPPPEILDFIGKLSGASTATRYPTDLAELLRTYTLEAAQEYLRQAKETVEWIAGQLKS